MKNKLKIISIFSIVFAIIIAFTSSVNAFSFSCNDEVIDVGDISEIVGEDNFVIINFSSSNTLNLYVCPDGFVFKDVDLMKLYTLGKGKSYKLEDGVFTYSGTLMADMGVSSSGISQIIYSNTDLCDVNGEVVFQKAPAVAQVVLAPIAQEAPLEGIVQEIVGILPIVLIILVGLIGLRKALALLSQTLHKA